MNNSTSENHHAPWTAVVPLKKIENTKDNLRETDKRPSRDECTIRVFGWDHNGNPIPEEQAQLVDPPKSSSVNSTQQQSLVSSPNMQKTEEKDNKLPWEKRRTNATRRPTKIIIGKFNSATIPTNTIAR